MFFQPVTEAVSFCNPHSHLHSINLPLDQLESIHYSKDTPLFVYCRSGARSGRGVEYLKRAGYEKAENIGGIITYHGPMER